MAIKKDKSKASTKSSKEEKVDKKEKKVVHKEKKEKTVGFFKRIRNYFKEVKKEVSLVKWPSRKDMVKYSIATIAFVLFFSLFFYIIDLIVVAIKTWV